MSQFLNEIFEVWRKEALNSDLQDYPANFFEKVKKYLETRKESVETGIKGLGEKEERIIKEVLSNLLLLRAQKIFNFFLSNTLDVDKLNQEEISFVNLIKKEVEVEKFLKERKESKLVLVRFKRDVPRFISPYDLKAYGPFKKEELASLPRRVVEIFIEKKVVEVIG